MPNDGVLLIDEHIMIRERIQLDTCLTEFDAIKYIILRMDMT